MKIDFQYVNDIHGQTYTVQMTLAEWKKVINKLKKYEQALKIQSDLQEAIDQISILKRQEGRKLTLNEFANEL